MPRSFGFDKPFWGMVEPRDRALQTPARNHMVAASGEFAGTFMFLLFAYLVHSMAVSQASDQGLNGKASSQTVVFISLGYGFPLLVAVWTLFRVSGGLFNPAVTFGLCISGKLPWTRGLIFLPVQILGGICAAAVTAAIIPGDIANTQTTLAPKVSIAQGLFIEMFLTAELTFTVLMLAVEKSKGTFIAPIGVGLALFIAQLAGVYYTGASLNPVRSFGPCVAAANFQGYHWIYWLGPYMGAGLAAGYYQFLKFFNYEEANPAQDSANGAFHPEKDAIDRADSRSSLRYDARRVDSVVQKEGV